MSHTEFDGLVAVVTGGASGIGAATALRLSEAGASVARGLRRRRRPRVGDGVDWGRRRLTGAAPQSKRRLERAWRGGQAASVAASPPLTPSRLGTKEAA